MGREGGRICSCMRALNIIESTHEHGDRDRQGIYVSLALDGFAFLRSWDLYLSDCVFDTPMLFILFYIHLFKIVHPDPYKKSQPVCANMCALYK